MAKGYVAITIGYRRVDNLPLEQNTLFQSLEDAKDYAKNDPTAYIGQPISIVDNGKVFFYLINQIKDLSLVGMQALKFIPTESPYRIEHGLGAYPNVKCIDSNGNLIQSNVIYEDENVITVEWNGEFSGMIILD